MNKGLIISCILTVLCLLLAVGHSASASINSESPVISTANASREGKVLRSLPFISSEAIIAHANRYSSPVHDWGKRSAFSCFDSKLFIFPQPSWNVLNEGNCSREGSFPPLYLSNRVLLI